MHYTLLISQATVAMQSDPVEGTSCSIVSLAESSATAATPGKGSPEIAPIVATVGVCLLVVVVVIGVISVRLSRRGYVLAPNNYIDPRNTNTAPKGITNPRFEEII